MIMCDDLGWLDVGFNGNKVVKTPHLDNLAAEGIIFDRFYAAAPVCSPTRASCLTGRSPFRMGIHNANAGHLPQEEITLPELLKKLNYSTGHFGKWHLGTLTTDTIDANRGGRDDQAKHFTIPTEHGYDYYFCTESKVPTFDPMVKPIYFDTLAGESLRYGWRAIGNQTSESYGTFYWSGKNAMVAEDLSGDDSRIILDRVLPFIDNSQENQQPFFTTIWFHAPHLPLVCADTFRQIYAQLSLQEQLLFGSITALDHQVGRLIAYLKEKQIYENTMIWFCSDNGPEQATPGSAGPFKERKRSLYEGGIRVPAFCTWSDKIPAGVRLSLPMVTSDYLPTILSFIGSSSLLGIRPMDGEDLSKAIVRRDSLVERGIGFRYRENKYAWMTEQYKLISVDSAKTFQLYDLLLDPGEKNDLAPTQPITLAKMRNDLFLWIASCQASERGEDYH
jgi:arylsulfatase A-like enzyme